MAKSRALPKRRDRFDADIQRYRTRGPDGPFVLSGASFHEVIEEIEAHVTDKAAQIATLLAPTITSLGLELLGAEYLPVAGGATLRLYIDRPGADPKIAAEGVTIEDCEAVSREVSAQLDVEDPISVNYTLEVSSPGVDRPLFSAAQFAKFIGEQAKVTLKLPQDGRRRLTGRIVSVQADARGDGTISFDIDGTPFTAAADNIEKARLVPDWVALGYAPARDKTGRDARPGKQANTKPSDKQTSKPAPDAPARAE